MSSALNAENHRNASFSVSFWPFIREADRHRATYLLPDVHHRTIERARYHTSDPEPERCGCICPVARLLSGFAPVANSYAGLRCKSFAAIEQFSALYLLSPSAASSVLMWMRMPFLVTEFRLRVLSFPANAVDTVHATKAAAIRKCLTFIISIFLVIIGLFTANFFGQLFQSRQSLFSGAKRQLVLCARIYDGNDQPS